MTTVSTSPVTGSSPFGRRRFLAGLGGAAGLALGGSTLSACGGKSGSASSLPEGLAIVQRFPNSVQTPGSVRLPISLADTASLLTDDSGVDLPTELRATLSNMDTGATVAARVVALKHGKNMPVPYWPFVFEVPEVGIYSLSLDGEDATSAGVQILDPGVVHVPAPGEPLPGFDTPTVDDHRGMESICTRAAGTCPFHRITLNQALASGKPVVYLIGTPAFCQTGVCAPALEAVITISERLGDEAAWVHADVYSDSAATVTAPAVEFYNMMYEPALFITDASGVLRVRLDGVFDEDEIASTLAGLGLV